MSCTCAACCDDESAVSTILFLIIGISCKMFMMFVYVVLDWPRTTVYSIQTNTYQKTFV